MSSEYPATPMPKLLLALLLAGCPLLFTACSDEPERKPAATRNAEQSPRPPRSARKTQKPNLAHLLSSTREKAVDCLGEERHNRIIWETLLRWQEEYARQKGSQPGAATLNAHPFIARLYQLRLQNPDILEPCVLALMKEGADGFATDAGTIPLYRAAVHGHLDVIRQLLEQGADIHQTDSFGATPLHMAAMGTNNAPTVRYLIEQGANVNTPDHDGYPPIMGAILFEQNDIIELLLRHGADRRLSHKSNNSLLHMAAMSGKEKAAQCLIEQGLSVHDTNADGDTPLHTAASGGHLACAKLLLEQGANINARNRDQQTPATLARLMFKDSMAAFLRTRGGRE